MSSDGLRPIHGDKVTCEICNRPYLYFVWAFASDRKVCHRCIHKRPQSILDGLDDRIDIDKEQDLIYDEIEERERRDNPVKIPKMPRME